MKISRLYYSFHRSAQFLKFQRKTRVSSTVTLGGNVQRRTSLGSCFAAPSFLRQIVCRLKNRWKQALGWQRSTTPHFSYDLRSYTLNFDDAPSNHHIPPPV